MLSTSRLDFRIVICSITAVERWSFKLIMNKLTTQEPVRLYTSKALLSLLVAHNAVRLVKGKTSKKNPSTSWQQHAKRGFKAT